MTSVQACDPSTADQWLREALRPVQDSVVARVVPSVFDRYVALFQPVKVFGCPDETRRFSDVARGTSVKRPDSPECQYKLTQVIRAELGGDVSIDVGEEGSLPQQMVRALSAVLKEFTASNRCRVGLWAGYGFLSKSELAREKLPDPWDRLGRDYLLFEGEIDEMAEFRMGGVWNNSPNFWWPMDRSWFVATEIDLLTTYVGASSACAQAIVESEHLDACAVDPWDSLF